MRVAVLADVHGNVPALRAVLAELDREGLDGLVVAGDVVAGAYPREALELLAARPEHVVWIRGNAEREAVAAWDGAPTSAMRLVGRRRGARWRLTGSGATG